MVVPADVAVAADTEHGSSAVYFARKAAAMFVASAEEEAQVGAAGSVDFPP